jgi:hypothetical protein
METIFSNSFFSSEHQPDDKAKPTARDAEEKPSRLQLPKLFTDTEPVKPEPAKQSSPDDVSGVSYTYYRGVRTAVHKAESQPARPTTEPTPVTGAIVSEQVSTPAAARDTIIAEAVAVASTNEPVVAEALAVSATEQTLEPSAEAVQAIASTRNKSRFRMPRLFADTEEIDASELQVALKQTSAAKAQPSAAPIVSAPAEPTDDGVTYTYYRGIKTAVSRPGAQPNMPQNTAPTVAAMASPAITASAVASPAPVAASCVAAQAVAPSVEEATPAQIESAQPSPEAALLHEMELLRAGMMEMSRRLQAMQEMQQPSARKDDRNDPVKVARCVTESPVGHFCATGNLHDNSVQAARCRARKRRTLFLE